MSMKISVICFTKKGALLCKNLCCSLQELGYDIKGFCAGPSVKDPEVEPLTEPLQVWTGRQFAAAEGIVFIGATGIAVRSVAPFLKDKTQDPAVLVMDEAGGFVIPLLSGHIGGANALSQVIAREMQAVPVITTATDINHQFAVDVFAQNNGLFISRMDYARKISAAVLNGEAIGFQSDFAVEGDLPPRLSQHTNCEYGIYISLQEKEKPFDKTLHLIPRCITIGIGCRRGKTFQEIEKVVRNVLEENGISMQAAAKVATVDLKKDEAGILTFCETYGLQMETYTAQELQQVPGDFCESDYVKEVTGVGNVCERAAVLGSRQWQLLQRKYAENGITVSIAMEEWSVKF